MAEKTDVEKFFDGEVEHRFAVLRAVLAEYEIGPDEIGWIRGLDFINLPPLPLRKHDVSDTKSHETVSFEVMPMRGKSTFTTRMGPDPVRDGLVLTTFGVVPGTWSMIRAGGDLASVVRRFRGECADLCASVALAVADESANIADELRKPWWKTMEHDQRRSRLADEFGDRPITDCGVYKIFAAALCYASAAGAQRLAAMLRAIKTAASTHGAEPEADARGDCATLEAYNEVRDWWWKGEKSPDYHERLLANIGRWKPAYRRWARFFESDPQFLNKYFKEQLRKAVLAAAERSEESGAASSQRPAAEPEAESAAAAEPEPAAEPAAEVEAEPEPAAEPVAEPASKPEPEPTAEPAPEPATEPEPAAEPEPEAAAEATAAEATADAREETIRKIQEEIAAIAAEIEEIIAMKKEELSAASSSS